MMQAPAGHVLTVRRAMAAPPERVFAAWTDPERFAAWYRLDESWTVTTCEMDLRVGGAYRFGLTPPNRAEIVETGEYVEIDPPRRLVYTQESAGIGGGLEHVLVSIDFVATDDGTEVIVTEAGYSDVASRDLHASGWPKFLDALAGQLSG